MKTFILILFQGILIIGLLYSILNVSQLDSSSLAFEESFKQEALTFKLRKDVPNHNQPNRPDNKPKDPEPKDHNPNPDPEPNPKETQEPPNPTGPTTETEDPQEPQEEEPSDPSGPTPKPETPSEQDSPSSSIDLKADDIQDYDLKILPGKSDPKTRCLRKDRRKEKICQITGMGCIRYSPTQELPHFWFICALYTPNQAMTARLYEMHKNFLGYAHLYGIQTQAIEVVFPGQDFIATKPNNEPHELQFQAEWIFNMRENLVNVGAKRLPDDWEYIAWIDAHIFWDENRYWFEDVVVELGKNNIVHMLESNDFFDERNKTNFFEQGVAKLWHQKYSTNLNPIRQCGMAWATRRDIFEGMNGLLDVCIGTKCDLYQNYAYFGEVFTQECTNPEYAAAVRNWQLNAMKYFQKKVGYVKGNIIHFQHCIPREGCRTSNYDMMTQAMSRMNYNPNQDMKRDSDGRMEFNGNWELAKTLWQIYGGGPRRI